MFRLSYARELRRSFVSMPPLTPVEDVVRLKVRRSTRSLSCVVSLHLLSEVPDPDYKR